jgi:hypothetical protein
VAAAVAQWRYYAALWLAGMVLIGIALAVLVCTQIFETRFTAIGLPAGCILLGLGGILLLSSSSTRRRVTR